MRLCPCGSEGGDKIERGEATLVAARETKSVPSLPPKRGGTGRLRAFRLFCRQGAEDLGKEAALVSGREWVGPDLALDLALWPQGQFATP
jgi:hypothetical protein